MSGPAAMDHARANEHDVFATVPFTRLLGVKSESVSNGVAVLSLALRPELTNLLDACHGGVVMTLLDVAMARAAASRVDFVQTAVTVDMTSQFVAPGRGALTVTGRAAGGGRSLCFCDAEVRDAEGTLVARAQGTFRYVARRAASGAD